MITTESHQSLRTIPRRDTPLARLIRDRRLAMGPRMSQSKLAELLGVDRAHLSRLESGQRVLHHNQIATVAAVMDLDSQDLALAIAGLDPVGFRASLTAPLEDALREAEASVGLALRTVRHARETGGQTT